MKRFRCDPWEHIRFKFRLMALGWEFVRVEPITLPSSPDAIYS
jgi:hypothetical protein